MNTYISKLNFDLYDSKLKEYIDETLLDNLDLLSYGVSWKPNVADPHLTRVGNMTYHKTLPIQNNMKGCIALMKDGAKIIYYLNPNDWRWHTEEDKSLNTLKDLTLIVTDEVYILVNDIFKDLRFEHQWIKINSVPCEVTSIDVTTKTATLLPDSELEAGTYDVELGAILNGYDGEVMVEVPEFWIKSWDTDTRREVRVTPTYIDSTWEHLEKTLVSPYGVTRLNAVPENMGYLSLLKANELVSICNIHDYCRGGTNKSEYDEYISLDTSETMLGKPRSYISLETCVKSLENSGKNVISYLDYKNIFYWLYVIEYASFFCGEDYNEALTSEGYHLGGLGRGVLITAGYNSTYTPIFQNGILNSYGNTTKVYKITLLNGKTANVSKWHGIEFPFGNMWTILDGILIHKVDNNQLVYIAKYRGLELDVLNMIKLPYILPTSGYVKEFNLGNSAHIIPRITKGIYFLTEYRCTYLWDSYPKKISGVFAGNAYPSSLCEFLATLEVSYETYTSITLSGTRIVCVIK